VASCPGLGHPTNIVPDMYEGSRRKYGDNWLFNSQDDVCNYLILITFPGPKVNLLASQSSQWFMTFRTLLIICARHDENMRPPVILRSKITAMSRDNFTLSPGSDVFIVSAPKSSEMASHGMSKQVDTERVLKSPTGGAGGRRLLAVSLCSLLSIDFSFIVSSLTKPYISSLI
jgi:hypothetical protein